VALFRFVHAADLHLDSPFLGIGATIPPALRDTLQRATFDAYDNLIDLCVREHVDALLVAGDVYDSSDKSLRAQLRFVAGLQRLHESDVRTFLCHGNHDPLDGWDAGLDLPPSAHRFGPELEAVALDPGRPDLATIYGISYPSQRVVENLVPRFVRNDSSAFAIGLLHANVGSNPGHTPYAPCTVDDLARAGLDYWALGHVHTRQVLRERGPAIVYPGNIQGLHPNETGARGAFLVSVDSSGTPTTEFRPLDAVRWEHVSLDISESGSIQQVLDVVDRRVAETVDAAAGRAVVYRLELHGRTALYGDILHGSNLDDLQASLNGEWAGQPPFAWCERITHNLRPEFDRDAALAGGDFLAEVLAGADAIRSDPGALAELQAALQPLYLNNDRARKALKSLMPEGDELLRLLDEAETECVDRLQGGVR
jgi:DNA repair protein SbcD/Mre11